MRKSAEKNLYLVKKTAEFVAGKKQVTNSADFLG